MTSTATNLAPADLAPATRWVAWRTEPHPATGRITKVPKDPRTLRDAGSTRPETWGRRADAEAALGRLPVSQHGPQGLGLVLGEWADGLRLGGVDLDTCRDPVTGEISPWAGEVLDLLGSYAEVSPSATGAKVFFLMEAGAVEALRRAGLLEKTGFGRSFKRGGTGTDHPPAIEVHLGGRYYAWTGERLTDAPPELRAVPTAVLRRLLGVIGPAFARHADDNGQANSDRSAKAFRLARRIRAQGGSFAEFCAALDDEPDTAAWKAEKGSDRELQRAWDRSGEPDAWPEPRLDLATADAMPVPPLPLNIFPSGWRTWIKRAALQAGAPPDYSAGALLAVTGAALGNARWGSPWDGWAHPPVVNVATIGVPSSGKSPGADAAALPLAELLADLNDDWDERQRAHRSAKQEAKERRAVWEAEVKQAVKEGKAPPQEPASAREPEEPKKRRAYTTDATMEAARDLSAANPRGLLLHRDELAGFVAGMGRYGNGDGASERAFWLQAYEGRRWASARVKDGDNAPEIPHLAWGILGGFQPDRLASTLLTGDDDGLAARFLYVWPTSPAKVSARPDGSPLPFDLKAKLRRLRELAMPDGEPVVLRFTEDAAVAMQEWRGEVKAIETTASGLFLSWVGKLPGFAVRLSVIFAHLAWLAEPDAQEPDSITLDDFTRAVGFLSEYAVPMARRAFGEAALPEAERDARRLARWYLACALPRPATLNARELRRMANGPGILTAARVEAALNELAELGLVRRALGREGERGGRQRADWAVHPALCEGPAP